MSVDMHLRLLGLLAAGLALAAAACAPAASQTAQPSTSVQIPILVSQDQVFGYVEYAQIGVATFSSTEGIVGSLVTMQISLDDLPSFLGDELVGSLTVINTDLVRDPNYATDFTMPTNTGVASESVQFYIPQVLAEPAVVDFQLTLSFTTENVQHKPIAFDAGFVYQFAVTSGRPAS
jgi:hypothetical protein